jgi:hypothetical protein
MFLLGTRFQFLGFNGVFLKGFRVSLSLPLNFFLLSSLPPPTIASHNLSFHAGAFIIPMLLSSCLFATLALFGSSSSLSA